MFLLSSSGRGAFWARCLLCLVALLVFAAPLPAQSADPAYTLLFRAYESLRAHDYDAAISSFLQAIQADPTRPSIREDLAYTYLKVGENELARDQFHEVMRLDSANFHAALEYAFFCYDTRQVAEARRTFDRVRKTATEPFRTTAEQAFRNVDAPLAAGIERWKSAIGAPSGPGADNFSAHFELATLADERDDLPLAAEHYEKAWRLVPARRSVLVDLGRVWKALGRLEDANAALLAASRSSDTRTAEMARSLLPNRYPYVSEFRRALDLDPTNNELRREFAYLLLNMKREPEAEAQFRTLTEADPKDLLSAAQLGFLLYAEGQRAAAQPLFDRVLAGNDEELSTRVRAVLHLPNPLRPRSPAPDPQPLAPKEMAERSLKAGYMKDALRYLEIAQEADPTDPEIMLKLGWTNNILHQDLAAFHWFDLARKSPDQKVASEAEKAWQNLRPDNELLRTSFWIYPLWSSRWHDFFGYGQLKTEIRTGLHIRPYISTRFVGDTRLTVGAVSPEYLSESAVILALGLTTDTWHHLRGWFEAGYAMGYLQGHLLPDYRGGLSAAGRLGRFADTALDAIYLSAFDKDFIAYDQSRIGYLAGRIQLYCNANATVDARRQYWANFVETGPGIRLVVAPSAFFTVNLLRGAYLMNAGNPRRPNYYDVRAGVWYAFTH